jgi:hypothetical protein
VPPALGILISLVSNRHRTVAGLLGNNVGFLVQLLFVVFLLTCRQRLQSVLNRHYGRDQGTRMQAGQAAAETMRKAATPETLAEVVLREVEALLAPVSTVLLLEAPSGEVLEVAASSIQPRPHCALPTRSPLLQHLEHAAAPQELTQVPHALRAGLGLMRMRQSVAVLAPLVTPRRFLVGLLVLGDATSGDPYTQDDLVLLHMLCDEAARTQEALLLEKALVEQRTLSTEAALRWATERDACVLECPACRQCFGFPQTACARDGTPLLRNRSISRVINNHNELESRIESGGMSTVYQGRDLLLNRSVAIKIIAPSMGEGPGRWIQRAEREGQALARLTHPNIVIAYDFGVHELGAAYLVMELIHGRTLRQIIVSAQVTPARVASWFDQILDGLSAAHTHNRRRLHLPHRDCLARLARLDPPSGQGCQTATVIDAKPAMVMCHQIQVDGRAVLPHIA